MKAEEEALLIEAYELYKKQKKPIVDSRESGLMKALFPDKAFTGETLQCDVLDPLSQLIASLNAFREKLGVELLRESVSIASEASVAESLNGFKLQLEEIADLARGLGLTDVIDSMNTKLDDLVTSFKAFLIQSRELDELEKEVLLQLKTKLT